MSKYSEIIAGCMTWGAWGKQLSTSEMSKLMNHCLDTGITTFDHADIYGDYTTEAAFGKAFSQSNIIRDNIQLISKCGIQYIGKARPNRVKHYEYTKDYIIWSVEQSLTHLQTTYLDLLLLHRPSPLMHPDEIAETVEILKKSGKIIAFGVSNFTPSQTDLIASSTDISVNQIEFSLTQYNAMHDGSLDHMLLHKIRPMAWSPLGNYFKETSERNDSIQQELQHLCTKYNATESQLLLAWILQHPAGITPVIGTTNPDRIQEAAEAIPLRLETEDWFALLVASQGHKVP